MKRPMFLSVKRFTTFASYICRTWPVHHIVAATVLAMFIIGALTANLLAPYDPLQAIASPLALPSAHTWLGTDALGRDVFSRLLFGSRLSLTVAGGACLTAGLAGLVLGALGGLMPRIAGFLLQRLLDVWQSLPLLVVAVVLVAAVNTSMLSVTMAIAIPLIPKTARLVRTLVLGLRQCLFIQAAHIQGIPFTRILIFHLLPNLYAPLTVMISAQLGQAVLLEASLSFLGLGIPDPAPSWGRMIAELTLAESANAPWLLWAPGTAIALLVISSNLLGDALGDQLDPIGKLSAKQIHKTRIFSGTMPLTQKTTGYNTRNIFQNKLNRSKVLNDVLNYILSLHKIVPKLQSNKPSTITQDNPPPAVATTEALAKPSSRSLLEVENLSVRFHARQGTVQAVSDLSFKLEKGKTLGLVGESGCGKTVAALSILRLIPTPAGEIYAGNVYFEDKDLVSISEEKIRDVRGNDISMIFQEPMTSLNPVLTVGFQISEVMCLHQGLSKKDALEKAIEMLRVVRIPEPQRRVHEYPHNMSGGMRQRVMIAMALSCNPKVLIADEPTTALDVTIQAQILELMADIRQESGAAVLMITHDLGVIAQTCQRVAVMYAGRKVEESPINDLFNNPKHPYTLGLLRSLPGAQQGKQLQEIAGIVPPLHNLPVGCAFQDRCPYVSEQCRQQRPPLEEKSAGHQAACWHTDKISD